MMKTILFLISLTIIIQSSSSWTTIECNYKNNGDYHVIKNIYFCSVNNNPLIYTEESARINSVNGEQLVPKSYNDVTGFHARQKAINFFPRGLQTYFKNLKVIQISSCGLKEIHKSDLKPFSKLVYIFLESNYVEVIEEGLFDNNLNLEGIGIWESSVVHIDSNVFDNLSKLSCLWLSLTSCAKKDVKDSKDKVKELINVVKKQCKSEDYIVQSDQLKDLENEQKTLNSEEIKIKIENFEKTFNNSIFLKYQPLKNRLASLKIPKIDKNLIDLTSKVNLEPEKCSNVSNYEDIHILMRHEFNHIKNSLNDLKATNFEDKFAHTDEKLSKIDRKLTKFDEKLDKIEAKIGNIEKRFTNFEVKNAEKFDKMDKEFVKTRQKIGIISDEIKGIEERLIKKYEEILEEKLGKVFQF